MARKFYSEIRVVYADTDAMGVAHHGSYVRWFEIGRTEYLRQIGYPYSELERDGLWLPVLALECRYKSPVMYDDVLSIACWAGELRGASVVMRYEITRKGGAGLLAEGHTKHAVTDTGLKPIKIKRVWPKFYEDVAKTLED
jgi:acyl-CoA thioester hydrolase